MIWKTEFTLEQLNASSENTMVSYLDIEFIEYGIDYLVASMPVDHRTVQPYGILHGGASVVLAETLGSTAASLCLEKRSDKVVGIEINASHLRAATDGFVYGKARPVRIGNKVQVWDIEIKDEEGKKTCVSRFTILTLAGSG